MRGQSLILTSVVMSALLMLFSLSHWAYSASPGDVVYLCYEKNDGSRAAARAQLVDNSTEEHTIKLIDPATNWKYPQNGGTSGSMVYEHESMVLSSREACLPETSQSDSALNSATRLCRVQKGGVLKDYTVLDEEVCEEIKSECVEIDGQTSCPVYYVWPSGSKTVVEYKDEYYSYPMRINGNKAIYPNAIADHTCVLNTKSDNLFCVLPVDEAASENQTAKTASAGAADTQKQEIEQGLSDERYTTLESFPAFEVATFRSQPWFLASGMRPIDLINLLRKENWKNIRIGFNGYYVDNEDGRTKEYLSRMRLNGNEIENFKSVIAAPNFLLTDFHIHANKEERGKETVAVSVVAPNLVVDASYRHTARYEAEVVQKALKDKYGMPDSDKGRVHMKETEYQWKCEAPVPGYDVCPIIRAFANREQFSVSYQTQSLRHNALEMRKEWAKKAIEAFHASQNPNQPRL